MPQKKAKKKQRKKTRKSVPKKSRISQVIEYHLQLLRRKNLIRVSIPMLPQQIGERFASLNPNHEVLFGTLRFRIREV